MVLAGLGYLDYASCYIVGHNEVYNHHLKPAAIVLWVLIGLTQVSILVYWGWIIIRGPGRMPKMAPYDIYATDASLLRVPDVFVCDEHGFPFWCSHCQSVKQHRLFHLGDTGYCIAKFDHYCLWVGTAIGRDNMLLFIKFLQFFGAYFVVILCYIAYTTRAAFARTSANIPHYVILYVFCFFWINMIAALFCVTTYYISTNSTTLDDITVKNARAYSRYEARLRKNPKSRFIGRVPRMELGVRYVNVAHEQSRKIVTYSVVEKPWNHGFRNNLINLVHGHNIGTSNRSGPPSRKNLASALAVYILPYMDLIIRPHSSPPLDAPDEFSLEFMASIMEKISKGDFAYASYLLHMPLSAP